jgi:PPOX class probable F420-dependent enzyme
MATLTEKQAKLFTDRNWGVIATIREDGSPQATPVWIDYDGENVLVNSAHGRTKVKNVERDPRATVTVLPAKDQQSGYVMVSGPATVVEEGALEHINMLARKYLGEVGDVHQRHVAEHSVEARVCEPRLVLRVPLHICDAALIGRFMEVRVTEHLARHVDAGHVCPEMGEQPCILTLPAREGEHDLAGDLSQKLFENGIVKPESVRVEDTAVGIRDPVVGRRRSSHYG